MNATTGLPFDDIRRLLEDMPGPDEEAAEAVRARDARLTKPPGALGRMEEIAVWLARWQGRHAPRVERPVVAVFAGVTLGSEILTGPVFVAMPLILGGVALVTMGRRNKRTQPEPVPDYGSAEEAA